MQTQTHWARHALRGTLAFLGILVLLLAGCASEDAGAGDDAPTFNGVDPTLACASDKVGWNFATGGETLDTAQGTSLTGIQITEASYGMNCNPALAGNATSKASAACNGETHCEFQPFVDLYKRVDPIAGCFKAFTVKWKCGTDGEELTRTVPAEAGFTKVEVDCGPPIRMQDAVYGQSCGAYSGEERARIFNACDGRRNCSYTVDGTPDPARGCSKDMLIRYWCSDDPDPSKGYLATMTVPAEAKGKTAYLACSGEPRIKVRSAHYGDNCASQLGVDTRNRYDGWFYDARAKCDGKRTCDYDVSTRTLGDPVGGCAKDYQVTYTCGVNPTVLTAYVPPEANGKKARLSCEGATAFKPPFVVPQGEKACVPKTCAWNESRGADMTCKADPSIQRIQGISVDTYEVGGKFNPYLFKNVGTLRENVPYDFTLKLKARTDPGHISIAPWLTATFQAKDGRFADAFVCALPPIDVDNTQGSATTERSLTAILRNNTLPPSCFDVRANPYADLARRLRTTENDVRANWTLGYHQMHFSVDVEGKWGLFGRDAPAKLTSSPVKPNPPGFFYDQSRNFLDQIAYYQQRELLTIQSPFGFGSLPFFTTWTLAPSNNISVVVDDTKVTNGAVLPFEFFASPPSIGVDVRWTLAGDTPLHPASPNNPSSAESLTKKNLRATVLVYPEGDEASAVAVGSIPLADGNATGKVSSRTLTMPDTVKDRVFGAWSNAGALSMKTCIDVDGRNTRNGFLVYTPGMPVPAAWSVTIANPVGCLKNPNAIILNRSITKKPLPSEKSTTNVSNTKSNASGDGANSSGNDTGSDKSCTTVTVNGQPVTSCVATSRGSTTGSGNFAQGLYSADASTTRTETTASVSATPRMTAEALGFQVIDVEDESQKQEFGKGSSTFNSKDPKKISLAPNWAYIIKTSEATNAAPPPAPKLTKSKVGGRDGLGLSFGLKIAYGGFGVMDIGADIGVSISLDFEMKFQPDDPYPCIRSDGKKCYAFLPSSTQTDAQKACQVKGGKLAEMNTAADRANLLGAMQSRGTATRYWVGGQLAYSYVTPACGRSPGTAACIAEATTSYRWIGSDRTFATAKGGGTPAIDPASVPTPTEVGALRSQSPTDAGIAYQYGNAFSSMFAEPQTNGHEAICEYDGAAKVDFQQWSLALNLGAGAGLHMQLCVPVTGDILGLCIRGQLNFVDFAMAPQFGHRNYDLYDGAGRRFGARGNTFVDIPWKLNLLAGRVDLTANFFFASVTWNLAEYEGFKAASGSLYTYNSPTREVF